MRRYFIWGFVLGAHLPQDLELPHVRIRHLDPEEYTKWRRSHTALKHTDIGDRPSSSGIAADFRVRSQWGVFLWADAVDAEAAYRQAVEDHLPPVVALLSALTADPVEVDIVRIVEEGTQDPPHTPYTLSAFFRIVEPEPLTPEVAQELRNLIEAVRSDRTGRDAATALANAIAMGPVTGGTAVNSEAVLLRYFFVIEGISKAIGYSQKDQHRINDAEASLVAEVRKNLLKGDTAKQQVKQLRQAIRKLDVLNRKFLGEQIQHTAQVLQVPVLQVEEALRLVDLRNKRLGHAGKADVTGDELQAWIVRARPVAFEFLLAYARSLGAGKRRNV